jgi:hypothetical protein
MALKKSVKSVHGISVDGAYHRVESVAIQGKDKIYFALKSYASVENPSFAEKSYSCEYALESANPIAQAYEYLKTLPEFAGATDC